RLGSAASDDRARQPAARLAGHDLAVPACGQRTTCETSGRPVRNAGPIARRVSRLLAQPTLTMHQITCETCHQSTTAHDVVNYGSIEGGYQRLCGRCFNLAAASRLGLKDFEHIGFEHICMVDARGTEHEFHFRMRLSGPGMAIDAFELLDGVPGG